MSLAPFDRAHTSSYQRSMVAMSPSCTISEIQRNIGRKSTIVTYFTSILAPPLGVTASEFCQYLWRHKIRVSVLSHKVVCVISRSAILVQYRRVTEDGQTGTRRQHNYIALAQRRTVKSCRFKPTPPVFGAAVRGDPLGFRRGLHQKTCH